MNWLQDLYDTYENHLSDVGIGKVPLLPVSHTFPKAQVEITIDQDGNIKNVAIVPKADAGTIVPCTEESGSRTGSEPRSHPLCDKLQYVAHDIYEYMRDVTPKYKKKQAEMHKEYRESLEKWCKSDYVHPKAVAVLKYVQKNTVIKDLLSFGLFKTLKLDDEGYLKPKSASLFVRWLVYIPDDLQDKTWLDNDLFEKWTKYDMSSQKNIGICYITGNQVRLARNHPKYIREPGDSPKIISANDTGGFTYLGRFQTKEQACGVGYEVSQKAHSALRWLIAKQGRVHKYREGSQRKLGITIVAWAISGHKIPDPMADFFSIIGIENLQSDSDPSVSTAQELATKLNKKIDGYSAELGDTEKVVVMGLDAATSGRMAITYYRELTGSDYLQRINNWHKTCCWVHNYYKHKIIDKTGKEIEIYPTFVGAPAPIDIAKVAYANNDGKLRNRTIERILPCIIDGQKLPKDIVDSVVRRASNRIGMKDAKDIKEREWNKTLSIACALYKKYNEEDGFDMALDENRNTRDYLYGRLLALAENLEQYALRVSRESRQTNAARLMQHFAAHPCSTWRTIELALVPYQARLGAKASSLQHLMDKVITMFEADDFVRNEKLSGEFLLGYHCQRGRSPE